MNSFTIRTPKGERKIGSGCPVFIIAEMSANHNQDYEKAVQIIQAAAKAGADAIKLQTYTADTMTINCDRPCFIVGGEDNPDAWKGQTLYSLYRHAYTPWEWHSRLKNVAEDLGLVFFSTPFDPTAVDFLETLGVPLYKVASYEVTDIPLLKKIAKTKKPVIMSIGYATLDEVNLAISTLRENGTKDIVILHCVTGYSGNPLPEDTNMRTMIDIRKRFDVLSGFSDNNAGIDIPLQAGILGACVIEKHIVAAHDDGALDGDFSINPQEFALFVRAVRRAEKVMGVVNYGPQNALERSNRKYRRSLFVVADVKSGEIFTEQNVRAIRPEGGLEPKYYEEIIGKTAKQNIERGIPLAWDLIHEHKDNLKNDAKRAEFIIDSEVYLDSALHERLAYLNQKNNAEIRIEKGVKVALDVIFPDYLTSLHIEQYSSIGKGTSFAFENIRIGAHSVVGDNMCFGKKQMDTFIPGVQKNRMSSFKELIIGVGAQMYGDCEIYAPRVVFGNFIKMGKRVQIDGYKDFYAGHNVWVGRDSTLNTTGGLKIGNNTGIGEKCLIWSHGFWSDLLEGSNIFNIREVVVGNECWIAAGASLTVPGIKIADKVMMLPESNVIKSVEEENIVVGGNPARKVQTKKDGQLKDLVHFNSRNKDERYEYLKGVLDDFSNRFQEVKRKDGLDFFVWDVNYKDYYGKIVLLLNNKEERELREIVSVSENKEDIIIFSSEDILNNQLLDLKFTYFNYMTRRHSSLLRLDGAYNLLALEFIRGSNTYIAKFIPKE